MPQSTGMPTDAEIERERIRRLEREAEEAAAESVDTLTRLGAIVVSREADKFTHDTCLDAVKELKAWRDRFPMCWYDIENESIVSDSAPR